MLTKKGIYIFVNACIFKTAMAFVISDYLLMSRMMTCCLSTTPVGHSGHFRSSDKDNTVCSMRATTSGFLTSSPSANLSPWHVGDNQC